MKREDAVEKQSWTIFEFERAHIMRRMSLLSQIPTDFHEKIEHATN